MLVGINHVAVRCNTPAREIVAGATEGVGGEVLRCVVGEGLISHRTGGIIMVFVEVDGVGCPADMERACCRASVVACATDSHSAITGTAVITPRKGIVGTLGQGIATIGDSRHRCWSMVGVAHPVVALRHGDGSVAVGHRWVGYKFKIYLAEGLSRRYADSDGLIVVADGG